MVGLVQLKSCEKGEGRPPQANSESEFPPRLFQHKVHFCSSPSFRFGHRSLFSRELPASPWAPVQNLIQARAFCEIFSGCAMIVSAGSFVIAALYHFEVVFGIHVSIHQMSVTWKKYCFVLYFIQWDICAEIAYDLVWSCPTSKSVIGSWYRAHEVWLKIFHAYSCHYLGWQSCWRRADKLYGGRLFRHYMYYESCPFIFAIYLTYV